MESAWRQRLQEIIFEADTPSGKAFDVALILAIVISVCLIMMDSVSWLNARFGFSFRAAEWFFTGLFTVEFMLRLIAVRQPLRYVFSFFGMVDILAILPTYLSLVIPGTQSFLVIRVFRILRVFRVFKLGHYLGEAQMLSSALAASRHKIAVFLTTVGATVISVGALMYVIEGDKHGFTSIPASVYWAIVTMTTVGYGDIAPQTALGQFFAALLMIVGYGVIAVPTGIVTTELVKISRPQPISTQACPNCGAEGHAHDAKFCNRCAYPL